MLQIITGKFFEKEERHESAGRGVLYSNYRWVIPLETVVGQIEPMGTSSLPTAYAFSYKNQIEKGEGGFGISRIGDGEIIDQFRLLCSFGFRAIFSEDRSWIAHLCRAGTIGQSDNYVPSQLLPRYFTPRIEGSQQEGEAFAAFVSKVISLCRADYLSIINALRAFNGALEVIGSNLDLAYSMLVYALESLSQKYYQYQPGWQDYDERTRAKLDPILAVIPDEQANSIKNILLGHAHLKLKARFVEFICANVDAEYFSSKSPPFMPLQEFELRRAVRNIYDIRSAYVHELKPLLDQLRMPPITAGEVFRWELEPYLTFNGLVRLTDQVIRSLVNKLPSLEKEIYPWKNELPGVVRIMVSSEYWIHNATGFEPKEAGRYFEGFLSHYVSSALQGGPICDMSAVMKKIENLAGQGNASDRSSMVALYVLYNSSLHSEFQRAGWVEFAEKYKAVTQWPIIQNIAARLMLNGGFPWTYDEGMAALKKHNDERFHKNAFHLPQNIEVAVMVALANQALSEGKMDEYVKLIKSSLLNSSGNPQLQAILLNALEVPKEIANDVVIPRKWVPIDDVGL